MTTDDEVLERARTLWASGDYSEIAQRLMPASADLVETVGLKAGQRVLDVGVGDGNTAVLAARQGAEVTGIDLTPKQIELASTRAAAEGLELDLQVANAESLPFGDDEFDAVVSVFAMIFAPDHAAAAGEMARVCRPGGTVALTSWMEDAGGWRDTWRELAAEFAPRRDPELDAWGYPDQLEQRLRAAGLDDVTVEQRAFAWSFPSPEAFADYFLTIAPPFVVMRKSAEAQGKGDEVAKLLTQAAVQANQADDGSCLLSSPYLLATAKA